MGWDISPASEKSRIYKKIKKAAKTACESTISKLSPKKRIQFSYDWVIESTIRRIHKELRRSEDPEIIENCKNRVLRDHLIFHARKEFIRSTAFIQLQERDRSTTPQGQDESDKNSAYPLVSAQKPTKGRKRRGAKQLGSESDPEWTPSFSRRHRTAVRTSNPQPAASNLEANALPTTEYTPPHPIHISQERSPSSRGQVAGEILFTAPEPALNILGNAADIPNAIDQVAVSTFYPFATNRETKTLPTTDYTPPHPIHISQERSPSSRGQVAGDLFTASEPASNTFYTAANNENTFNQGAVASTFHQPASLRPLQTPSSGKDDFNRINDWLLTCVPSSPYSDPNLLRVDELDECFPTHYQQNSFPQTAEATSSRRGDFISEYFPADFLEESLPLLPIHDKTEEEWGFNPLLPPPPPPPLTQAYTGTHAPAYHSPYAFHSHSPPSSQARLNNLDVTDADHIYTTQDWASQARPHNLDLTDGDYIYTSQDWASLGTQSSHLSAAHQQLAQQQHQQQQAREDFWTGYAGEEQYQQLQQEQQQQQEQQEQQQQQVSGQQPGEESSWLVGYEEAGHIFQQMYDGCEGFNDRRF